MIGSRGNGEALDSFLGMIEQTNHFPMPTLWISYVMIFPGNSLPDHQTSLYSLRKFRMSSRLASDAIEALASIGFQAIQLHTGEDDADDNLPGSDSAVPSAAVEACCRSCDFNRMLPMLSLVLSSASTAMVRCDCAANQSPVLTRVSRRSVLADCTMISISAGNSVRTRASLLSLVK